MSTLLLTGAGAAGASVAFDPTVIAGLQGWWKADAGTDTTTDGVGVATWADQSGNGRTLTQATGGRRPLYKAAIVNGRPVLRFDGIDDFIKTAAFALNQPSTVFIVFNQVAWTDGRGIADAAVTVNTRLLQQHTTSGQVRLYSGGPGGASLQDFGTGVFHVLRAEFNGASSAMSKDNNAAVVDSTAVNTNASGFTLGANGDGSTYSQIDVGEVALYNSVLSSGDQQSMQTYFSTRYAI